MRATDQSESRQTRERHWAEHGSREVPEFPEFIVPSRTPCMQWAEEMALRVGSMDLPALIVGEVGTGRQLFARWIHQISPRRRQQMVCISCSDARLETLGEALRKLEESREGVLFLHEIADLDCLLQLKVLALLQAEEISKGSSDGQGKAYFRLIASTARLEELTAPGTRFRPELYYRLSSILIRLPPLRERKQDIPGLVEFFRRRYAAAFQHNDFASLGQEEMRLLYGYGWPGNVRELENLVKRMVLFGPSALNEIQLQGRINERHSGELEGIGLGDEATPSLKEVARAAAQRAEKELIVSVLNRTRWNRRQTARQLAISYKTLLYKLKQLGLGKDKKNGGGKENAHGCSASLSNRTEKGYA